MASPCHYNRLSEQKCAEPEQTQKRPLAEFEGYLKAEIIVVSGLGRLIRFEHVHDDEPDDMYMYM